MGGNRRMPGRRFPHEASEPTLRWAAPRRPSVPAHVCRYGRLWTLLVLCCDIGEIPY